MNYFFAVCLALLFAPVILLGYFKLYKECHLLYLKIKMPLISGQVYDLNGIGKVRINNVSEYLVHYYCAIDKAKGSHNLCSTNPDLFRENAKLCQPDSYDVAIARYKMENDNLIT